MVELSDGMKDSAGNERAPQPYPRPEFDSCCKPFHEIAA